MTTTILYADANDGYVHCNDTVYNTCVNGASPTAFTGGNEGVYGLGRSGADYDAYQTFLQFDHTHPTDELVTAAQFALRHSQHTLGAQIDAEIWTYDFGASVDSSDWMNPLATFNETRVFRVINAELSGTSQDICAGSDDLVELLAAGTGTYRFVVVSNRERLYDVNNTADEWQAIWLAETALDPALIVSTMPRSALHGVMGAQVQLSDGTWCVLESDGATTPTVTLRHVDTSGTATTKATVPTGETAGQLAVQPGHGAQQLALVVDSSDNLYVIGREGTTENNFGVKAYVKGSGYTWTPAATPATVAAFGSWDNRLNNFTAAWHSVGGGTLVVFASRTSSDGYHSVVGYEGAWAICSAATALAHSGTLVRASGSMVDQFTPTVSPYAWSANMNETGTGMDATALSSTKGVVHTWSRYAKLGENRQTTKARYILNSSGTGFSSVYTTTPTGSSGTWGVKSGAGKLRVLPISSDTFATVSADSDSTWGLTVAVYRNSGTNNSFTLLGRVRLDNESLTTMPSAATLAESAAWDAIFVAGANKIWVYYFDTGDGRRLMRTAVNLSTYTATRDEVEVNAAVGASGSTNLAVRVARTAAPWKVLVAVANRTSGGTHSTSYIVDSPNEAPLAPTLATRSNFDASASAAFSWTFNDVDSGDTQSAFQLQVNSASGVGYYDSGYLAGTISYVGVGTAVAGDNTSLNPTLPASAQAGDLLILLASIRNAGTGTVDTPTGWRLFAEGTGGNFRAFGRIMLTGSASAANTPTVSFTGGAAGATTLAQIAAWRGTDQDITTVMSASAGGSFTSAQNVPWSALTVPTTTHYGIRAGWKQDDWSSVAAVFGFNRIADVTSTTGDDASMTWEHQTGTGGWFGGSWTVTGGAAAISRSLSLSIRPYQAPTASSFTLPASTLTQPGSWQWRVRTYDVAASAGAWSSYGTFSTGVGGTVTITDPVADNPSNFNWATYTVAWTLVGATQADYRVEVKRTDTEATVYTSGWVTSTDTTHAVTGLVHGVEQRIEVTTRTGALVESNVGTRLVTPDYAAPDDPVATVTAVDDDGHVSVVVNNPTPTGSRPTPTYTRILRRATTGPNAGEAWVTIGAVTEDGTWKDYSAASQVTYEYVARAIAPDGTTADSDTETATLALVGVWIHDPADPADAEDSAHQFAYGPGRSSDVDTMGEGTYYAGRTYPVFDFGEHESERASFSIQIPHGTDEMTEQEWLSSLATWRSFATSRKTLCVRDNRGRRLFGVVRGSGESDERWGTVISFEVIRVDCDETYTTIPS